jgi:hypothetical protein
LAFLSFKAISAFLFMPSFQLLGLQTINLILHHLPLYLWKSAFIKGEKFAFTMVFQTTIDSLCSFALIQISLFEVVLQDFLSLIELVNQHQACFMSLN